MTSLLAGETYGEVACGPVAGVTLSRHSPDHALPMHEHASAYVCAVLAGGFREQDPRGEAHRSAGQVIVHPAGQRHADAFGPRGALCLNLHIERAPDSLARAAGPDMARAIDELAAEVAKGGQGDRLAADSLRAEVLDLLTRPRVADDPTGVGRVLQALDDAPAADWSLGSLAAVAQRHPNHLARTFRTRMGVSLGAYRRRRRLIGLCLDLRLGTEPLSGLALDHGYADQAHMSREFRAFSGLSPSAYRRAAR